MSWGDIDNITTNRIIGLMIGKLLAYLRLLYIANLKVIKATVNMAVYKFSNFMYHSHLWVTISENLNIQTSF